LSLDLENVQRKQHNLTDSNDRACSRVHNCLAVAFAKCAVEASAVVRRQILPDEGLATELVHSLEDLLLSTTAEPSRTRTHTLYAAAYPRPGNSDKNRPGTDAPALSLKTTLFKCDTDSICDECLETLSCQIAPLCTLPTLLINRFAVVSTGWNTMSSAIPAHPSHVSRGQRADHINCTCAQNSGCV
jgi:hypothetical protein